MSSNCIAPFAWTRMVGAIPTDTPEQRARVEGLKRVLPERIAPFAVALMSEEGRKRVNGQIFGVRNNEIYFFSKTRPMQIMCTSPLTLRPDTAMPIDYDAMLATADLGQRYAYTEKDAMLYALAVGMGADPLDRRAALRL